MTWFFDADGYTLFFNRDEVRTRKIAHPPEIRTVNGVSFIAPIDADAGGTWLGVNHFGVSVCILNGAGCVDPGRMDYVSRGLLVLSLLDCGDRAAVFGRMQDAPMSDYRPFTLVVFQPGAPVATWAWNGRSVTREEGVTRPLISSSFRLAEVAVYRRRLFAGLGPLNTEALTDFHRSHVPEAGPFSVCMHRDDAQTVSLSRVTVAAQWVDFHYAPGPPCQTGFLPPIFLPRRNG